MKHTLSLRLTYKLMLPPKERSVRKEREKLDMKKRNRESIRRRGKRIGE